MAMSPRGPECECAITNEMVWAGPVIQLCHHSSREQAEEAIEKILDILGIFTQQITPEQMSTRTIAEMAEEYRKDAAGRLEHLLTQDETAIININFMRNLSLAAQMLLCSMIMQRDPGHDQNEDPARESD